MIPSIWLEWFVSLAILSETLPLRCTTRLVRSSDAIETFFTGLVFSVFFSSVSADAPHVVWCSC